MGLFDPTVLLSTRKSLANCLDFDSNVIIILFSVIWELPLFIFFVVSVMQYHI